MEPFEDFEVRDTGDPTYDALELICPHCDGVVCDVEHGDSLGTLARCAFDHLMSCTPAAGAEGAPSWLSASPAGEGR